MHISYVAVKVISACDMEDMHPKLESYQNMQFSDTTHYAALSKKTLFPLWKLIRHILIFIILFRVLNITFCFRLYFLMQCITFMRENIFLINNIVQKCIIFLRKILSAILFPQRFILSISKMKTNAMQTPKI